MTEEHVSRSDQKRTIGYIVKAWPRLSETFILNERPGRRPERVARGDGDRVTRGVHCGIRDSRAG